jgi:malonate decarboxylase alpha subunit
MTDWRSEQRSRDERLAAGSKFAAGKMVAANDTTALLEAVVRPEDRICLEGDNQKQADFLAACLAKADPNVLHDLHVVQSGIVLPEHIDLFEKGIAKKLDFSYSGPQSHAVPRVLKSGKVELGAIHTYIELFARYFVDLTPHVVLTVARSADRAGNLYMGPNTEDSPAVVEATAFKSGIVVAQVNEIADKLPRVDIPGDRVDFVVVAPQPFYVEPLFTREPPRVCRRLFRLSHAAMAGCSVTA